MSLDWWLSSFPPRRGTYILDHAIYCWRVSTHFVGHSITGSVEGGRAKGVYQTVAGTDLWHCINGPHDHALRTLICSTTEFQVVFFTNFLLSFPVSYAKSKRKRNRNCHWRYKLASSSVVIRHHSWPCLCYVIIANLIRMIFSLLLLITDILYHIVWSQIA